MNDTEARALAFFGVFLVGALCEMYTYKIRATGSTGLGWGILAGCAVVCIT